MATVDKKNLHFISIDKTIITCPLCMKHYQEPKMLACLHTACRHCLQSLYEHGNQPKELECPNCDVRTPIDKQDGIAKLQDNYYVRYLIKQVRDQRMEDLCETCKNTAATVKCSTCVEKLCGVCADKHMQNKDMVHELSFLLEDDVHKKELSEIEHASQGSRASVMSLNASSSKMKTEEEKDLPFEFYCDTCKSKECEHCENMKVMAQKNLIKPPEVKPEEVDPYPEPASPFYPTKSTEEPLAKEENKDGNEAQNQGVLNPSQGSQQQDIGEGTENIDGQQQEGEQQDGIGLTVSDSISPEDHQEGHPSGEQAVSLGSKASLHSQRSQQSARGSLHSGNRSQHEAEKQDTQEVKAVSQGSLRSRESDTMTPRPEPLGDADRQALDVSQSSHRSSPRDGSITPTPGDTSLPIIPGIPPLASDMETPSYPMPDPPAYDARTMMRPEGYGLQTVPEHEMEGVATSREQSPDQGTMRPAQGFSPIHPFPKPTESNGGMPRLSESAGHFGGGGQGHVLGHPGFPIPQSWPAFDERMSVSQDESGQEEIYMTEEEAQQERQNNLLKQQFRGTVRVQQPSSFLAKNFTIGTGTGPSGPKRKTAKPPRVASAGPKGRSSSSGGSMNVKGKRPEVGNVRRAQSVGSGNNQSASLVRKDPSPYHEKMQRESPNTWAHTESRKGMTYDLHEPRASTPTETRPKSGKKQNRLGFSVPRAAPGNQPKSRVIFPELSPQSKKGGVNLRPVGTEYTAQTKKVAGGLGQTGRNLQRPKSAMHTRFNPEAKAAAEESASLMSNDSELMQDPVLRQMQYEDENIFEGDPVLRSMAKFHFSQSDPTQPYPADQDHLDDNSVSMVSDNRDEENTGSQISLLSNDMDRKKSKMGLNIRSTGTMFDAFVPVKFSELIREDDDPILYDIEHTLQCITAMPAYEGFSPEELRFNDYTNFEEHTKGLLRKNYSLVHSVLQTGFKLDKLPENKVLPEKFVPGEPGKSTWPFDESIVKTPSASKPASVQGDTSLLQQQQQLNTSQQSNKSQRSTKSTKSQTGKQKPKKEEAKQGKPLTKEEVEKLPSVEKPKKKSSKAGSQEGISITEVLNGNINSQPASRASSRPNSKPPSRPSSRIGEAPAFEPPPSPDRGAGMADYRPVTPNSARQSIPNSARKLQQAGVTRTPSPQEIFEAMRRSQDGPFVTTGSHPNSPVPIVTEDDSQWGKEKHGFQGRSGTQSKLIFNFNVTSSKEDQHDHCLAFGLPETFGGLSIWEKWSLFQATRQYIPTLLDAAKEYWATRGRPKYTSRLQLGASVQDKKPQAIKTSQKLAADSLTTENEARPSATSTLDVKFEAPIICHRTKPVNGENNQITQIHCVSAMKEFEDLSLEELRLGDYVNWGYVIKAESTLCTEQVLEAILLKNAHEKMC